MADMSVSEVTEEFQPKQKTWTVPQGVKQGSWTLIGGGGGHPRDPSVWVGWGAKIVVVVDVVPGQTFTATIGGQAWSSSAGLGYSRGGSGGTHTGRGENGGGGGGSTGLVRSDGTIIAVAAGGGGGGGSADTGFSHPQGGFGGGAGNPPSPGGAGDSGGGPGGRPGAVDRTNGDGSAPNNVSRDAGAGGGGGAGWAPGRTVGGIGGGGGDGSTNGGGGGGGGGLSYVNPDRNLVKKFTYMPALGPDGDALLVEWIK